MFQEHQDMDKTQETETDGETSALFIDVRRPDTEHMH
jgi:hypothetical protein